jgi:hypothetical protein
MLFWADKAPRGGGRTSQAAPQCSDNWIDREAAFQKSQMLGADRFDQVE